MNYATGARAGAIPLRKTPLSDLIRQDSADFGSQASSLQLTSQFVLQMAVRFATRNYRLLSEYSGKPIRHRPPMSVASLRRPPRQRVRYLDGDLSQQFQAIREPQARPVIQREPLLNPRRHVRPNSLNTSRPGRHWRRPGNTKPLPYIHFSPGLLNNNHRHVGDASLNRSRRILQRDALPSVVFNRRCRDLRRTFQPGNPYPPTAVMNGSPTPEVVLSNVLVSQFNDVHGAICRTTKGKKTHTISSLVHPQLTRITKPNIRHIPYSRFKSWSGYDSYTLCVVLQRVHLWPSTPNESLMQWKLFWRT